MIPKHIYNPVAVKLLRAIERNPRITTTELVRETDSSYSSVRDYLHLLTVMGFVAHERVEGRLPVRYAITMSGRHAIRCIEEIDTLIVASVPVGTCGSDD